MTWWGEVGEGVHELDKMSPAWWWAFFREGGTWQNTGSLSIFNDSRITDEHDIDNAAGRFGAGA